MKNVRFHPEARTELYDAIRYYEEQQPGLGEDFDDVISASVRKLVADPQL